MIDFSWKVFNQTGSVETYLLIKEMERSDEAALSASGNETEKVEEQDSGL